MQKYYGGTQSTSISALEQFKRDTATPKGEEVQQIEQFQVHEDECSVF